MKRLFYFGSSYCCQSREDCWQSCCQLQAKCGPTLAKWFLLSIFESLYGPCSAVKRLICQTWWKFAFTWTSRTRRMAALLKSQAGIFHICVPLFQCKTRPVVSSFHHPCLWKNWSFGPLDPLNNRTRCLENLLAAGASRNNAPKGPSIDGDVFFLNILYSSPYRT